MKINGNAIRPGNVIEHKGRLWRAVKIQHTQPGKGGAYLQVELKDIRDGTKLNERFRASEDVERVRLDQSEYQYLYAEGDLLTFMDQGTYEQVSLNSDLVGEPIHFLQDGMIVIIESYEGEAIGVMLPESGRPPRPPTSRPRSRTACASWCRRTSRPAPGSWSTPPTAATWSGPRAEPRSLGKGDPGPWPRDRPPSTS
jgi:translation elongation factor P/translation initiation factor 5A